MYKNANTFEPGEAVSQTMTPEAPDGTKLAAQTKKGSVEKVNTEGNTVDVRWEDGTQSLGIPVDELQRG